jgi:hypothetical protein
VARSSKIRVVLHLLGSRRRAAEKKRAARAARNGAGSAKPADAAAPAVDLRERRRLRHAAKAAALAASKPEADAAMAKSLWAHAALLEPTAPWAVVAREFELNGAQVLDAHRSHSIPVGVTPEAASRFLALSASA